MGLMAPTASTKKKTKNVWDSGDGSLNDVDSFTLRKWKDQMEHVLEDTERTVTYLNDEFEELREDNLDLVDQINAVLGDVDEKVSSVGQLKAAVETTAEAQKDQKEWLEGKLAAVEKHLGAAGFKVPDLVGAAPEVTNTAVLRQLDTALASLEQTASRMKDMDSREKDLSAKVVELNQGLRERDGDIIELKRHLGLIQAPPAAVEPGAPPGTLPPKPKWVQFQGRLARLEEAIGRNAKETDAKISKMHLQFSAHDLMRPKESQNSEAGGTDSKVSVLGGVDVEAISARVEEASDRADLTSQQLVGLEAKLEESLEAMRQQVGQQVGQQGGREAASGGRKSNSAADSGPRLAAIEASVDGLRAQTDQILREQVGNGVQDHLQNTAVRKAEELCETMESKLALLADAGLITGPGKLPPKPKWVQIQGRIARLEEDFASSLKAAETATDAKITKIMRTKSAEQKKESPVSKKAWDEMGLDVDDLSVRVDEATGRSELASQQIVGLQAKLEQSMESLREELADVQTQGGGASAGGPGAAAAAGVAKLQEDFSAQSSEMRTEMQQLAHKLRALESSGAGVDTSGVDTSATNESNLALSAQILTNAEAVASLREVEPRLRQLVEDSSEQVQVQLNQIKIKVNAMKKDSEAGSPGSQASGRGSKQSKQSSSSPLDVEEFKSAFKQDFEKKLSNVERQIKVLAASGRETSSQVEKLGESKEAEVPEERRNGPPFEMDKLAELAEQVQQAMSQVDALSEQVQSAEESSAEVNGGLREAVDAIADTVDETAMVAKEANEAVESLEEQLLTETEELGKRMNGFEDGLEELGAAAAATAQQQLTEASEAAPSAAHGALSGADESIREALDRILDLEARISQNSEIAQNQEKLESELFTMQETISVLQETPAGPGEAEMAELQAEVSELRALRDGVEHLQEQVAAIEAKPPPAAVAADAGAAVDSVQLAELVAVQGAVATLQKGAELDKGKLAQMDEMLGDTVQKVATAEAAEAAAGANIVELQESVAGLAGLAAQMAAVQDKLAAVEGVAGGGGAELTELVELRDSVAVLSELRESVAGLAPLGAEVAAVKEKLAAVEAVAEIAVEGEAEIAELKESVAALSELRESVAGMAPLGAEVAAVQAKVAAMEAGGSGPGAESAEMQESISGLAGLAAQMAAVQDKLAAVEGVAGGGGAELTELVELRECVAPLGVTVVELQEAMVGLREKLSAMEASAAERSSLEGTQLAELRETLGALAPLPADLAAVHEKLAAVEAQAADGSAGADVAELRETLAGLVPLEVAVAGLQETAVRTRENLDAVEAKSEACSAAVAEIAELRGGWVASLAPLGAEVLAVQEKLAAVEATAAEVESLPAKMQDLKTKINDLEEQSWGDIEDLQSKIGKLEKAVKKGLAAPAPAPSLADEMGNM